MTNLELRSLRYEFLRQRSYPLLWSPHMCDIFVGFESDLSPEDLLLSSELLQAFRESGMERGFKGSADLSLQEVRTGCRQGSPLIMDFAWRGVSHVAYKLLGLPRDSISPTLMDDLLQEMVMQLISYEPQFNPNAPGQGEGASLESYYYAYPVKRASDSMKRLIFGGKSIALEKFNSISLEGAFSVSHGPANGSGDMLRMENIVGEAPAANAAFSLDTDMLGATIFAALEESTPKEKDVLALSLLMLGATDEEAGGLMGISKVGVWHRRRAFEASFPGFMRESLAQDSVSGPSDGEALAEEMCYGRADGRSVVDTRLTTSPEVEGIQWDKMEDVWANLLGD
jgi:hypothetical protein